MLACLSVLQILSKEALSAIVAAAYWLDAAYQKLHSFLRISLQLTITIIVLSKDNPGRYFPW
jgi:hypothetical protein